MKLPISSPARKLLFCPTNTKNKQKAEWTENKKRLFLDLSEKWGHRANGGSSKQRDRQAQNHSLSRQKFMSRTSENQSPVLYENHTYWRFSVDKSQSKNTRRPRKQRALDLLRFTYRCSTRFSWWPAEKNSRGFLKGRGWKEQFWNMSKHSVLSKARGVA